MISLSKSFLVNVAFFLSFVPFSRFLFFLDAKVQPIFAIFCCAIFIFWGMSRNLFSWTILFFALFISCVAFISLPYWGVSSLYQLLAYLAPLIVLLIFKDKIHYLNSKILFFWAVLYFIVGIMQYMNYFSFFQKVLNFVIPIGMSGSGYRGVSFLAPEPSNSAYIITQMFVLNEFFRKLYAEYKYYMPILFFSIGSAFLNKSGTVVLFFVMFYVSYCVLSVLLSKKLIFKFLGATFIVAFFTFSFFLSKHFDFQVRGLDVLDKTIECTVNRKLFETSTLFYVSGPRFFQVKVAYESMGGDFWGHGIGSASYYLPFYVEKSGAKLPGHWKKNLNSSAFSKPNSYGSQIALETGLLGFCFLLILLMLSLKRTFCYSKEMKPLILSASLVAWFAVFFRSTTAMPMPWVLLSFIYGSLSFVAAPVRKKYLYGGNCE